MRRAWGGREGGAGARGVGTVLRGATGGRGHAWWSPSREALFLFLDCCVGRLMMQKDGREHGRSFLQ